MSRPLCRNDGLYQWNATVSGIRDGMRQAVLVTVFCDTRYEALDAAVNVAKQRGYASTTVDHIKRNGQ